MNGTRTTLVALTAGALLVALSACQPDSGPTQKAGANVDSPAGRTVDNAAGSSTGSTAGSSTGSTAARPDEKVEQAVEANKQPARVDGR